MKNPILIYFVYFAAKRITELKKKKQNKDSSFGDFPKIHAKLSNNFSLNMGEILLKHYKLQFLLSEFQWACAGHQSRMQTKNINLERGPNNDNINANTGPTHQQFPTLPEVSQICIS